MRRNLPSRTMLVACFLFALALLMPATVHATTYYVDPAGSDSRAGTTTSTAWKTLAKIEDFGTKTGFRPGDSILLKRGGVWRERLNFPSSGTASSPITIDAYGTGNKPLLLGSTTGLKWTKYSGNIWITDILNIAPNTNVGFILLTAEVADPVLGVNIGSIVSYSYELNAEGKFLWVAYPQLGETYGRIGMYTANAGGPAARWPLMEVGIRDRGIVVANKSYVTIKNIDARYGTGGGFRVCNGSHHITFDGCEASYGGGTLTDILGQRAGDLFKIDTSSHDITVRNCRASNAYEAGISVEAWYTGDLLYNITIENNVVDRCSMGIGVNTPYYDGVTNTEVYNVYIRGNTLTNLGYGWTTPAMCSHGMGVWGYQNANAPGSLHDCFIENNDIDRFAWDGIRLFEGAYTVTGNLITGGTGAYQESAWDRPAGITIHGGSAVSGDIQGTVAYNLVYANDCSGMLFLNNTPAVGSSVGVYNNTIYNNGNDLLPNFIVCASNGIIAKNNILGGSRSIALSVETTTNMVSDNNCFFRPSGAMIRWRGQDFSLGQFAAYRSATSLDANSWAADPLFASAASGDFHLTALSPCVDAGVNLGYTLDSDGVALPQLASVDIGALELPRPTSTASPTVTLTSTAPALTNAPVPVTVLFSAPVTGFTASDLYTQNATVTGFFGSGANYTFTLTPSAQGTVGVYVPYGVALSGASRGNYASNQLVRTYDSIPPTVTLASTVTSPTKTSPIPVTITFSESVSDFVVSDVTVYNATVVSFTGSGTRYVITLKPITYTTAGIRVYAGVATDAAGNTNTAATPWSCYYYGSS